MKDMQITLNKTRFPRDRYHLINRPMGCSGEPEYSPTHKYSIANGVDRGNGYQGYISIDYFFKEDYIPFEVKSVLFYRLLELGYSKYLQRFLGDDFNLYTGVNV